jgi:hypothetical protein
VPGETFLWLVYQHVLPKGFRWIGDYGYLNGNAKKTLAGIQRALGIMVARLRKISFSRERRKTQNLNNDICYK